MKVSLVLEKRRLQRGTLCDAVGVVLGVNLSTRLPTKAACFIMVQLAAMSSDSRDMFYKQGTSLALSEQYKMHWWRYKKALGHWCKTMWTDQWFIDGS